jgi:FG-GAP-like repeat
VVANACPGTVSCSTTSNGALGVLRGNGDGTFRAPVLYGSGGFNSISVVVADVNRDGKPDLVVANVCPDYPSVAVRDVNRDGKPDLLLSNYCGDTPDCSGVGTVGVLINTSPTTYLSLINAVKEDESKPLVADIMAATLRVAEIEATKGRLAAADVLLKAFVDEVKAAESVKSLTAADAAILIQQAKELICEFDCRKGQCLYDEWTSCERRAF